MYKISKEELDKINYVYNLKRQKEVGDLDTVIHYFRKYVSKGFPICTSCPSSIGLIKKKFDEWYRHNFMNNYEIIEVNSCPTCQNEIIDDKKYCSQECFYKRNK